jgi:hypothetical protein
LHKDTNHDEANLLSMFPIIIVAFASSSRKKVFIFGPFAALRAQYMPWSGRERGLIIRFVCYCDGHKLRLQLCTKACGSFSETEEEKEEANR